MSSPMDPAVLEAVREAVAEVMGLGGYVLPVAVSPVAIDALLDDRDHHAERADAAEDATRSANRRADILETSQRRLQARVSEKSGIRGLLDDAEIERDMLRAKLIKSIGMEAYTEWSEETPF